MYGKIRVLIFNHTFKKNPSKYTSDNNVYSLIIGSDTYVLNYGDWNGELTVLDYLLTIPLNTNQSYSLNANSVDGVETKNYDNLVAPDDDPNNPIRVQQPYPGQFMQIDVVDWTYGIATKNNSCVPNIYGCTNPLALNYNPSATIDDGSCIIVHGCTDPLATNYNPQATVDDGSCYYGCTDSSVNMSWFYPMSSEYDNTTFLSPQVAQFGFDRFNFSIINNATAGISAVGDPYFYKKHGFTYFSLSVNTSHSEDIYDTRGGVYQKVGSVTAEMDVYGTIYTPHTTDTYYNTNNTYIYDAGGSCTLTYNWLPVYESSVGASSQTWSMGLIKTHDGLYPISNTNFIWNGTYSQTVTNPSGSLVSFTGSVSTTIINYISFGPNPVTYFNSIYGMLFTPERRTSDGFGTMMPLPSNYSPSTRSLLSQGNLQDFFKNTNYSHIISCKPNAVGPDAVYGCTNPDAANYNPNATVNDGSCVVYGCTNPDAFNYNPFANTDDGSCVPKVYGCTDPNAFNYNPDANVDNGSCVPKVYGCTDPNAFNYNPDANVNDGSCVPKVYGCTDYTAINYNPNANTDDGSCCVCNNVTVTDAADNEIGEGTKYPVGLTASEFCNLYHYMINQYNSVDKSIASNDTTYFTGTFNMSYYGTYTNATASGNNNNSSSWTVTTNSPYTVYYNTYLTPYFDIKLSSTYRNNNLYYPYFNSNNYAYGDIDQSTRFAFVFGNGFEFYVGNGLYSYSKPFSITGVSGQEQLLDGNAVVVTDGGTGNSSGTYSLIVNL